MLFDRDIEFVINPNRNTIVLEAVGDGDVIGACLCQVEFNIVIEEGIIEWSSAKSRR